MVVNRVETHRRHGCELFILPLFTHRGHGLVFFTQRSLALVSAASPYLVAHQTRVSDEIHRNTGPYESVLVRNLFQEDACGCCGEQCSALHHLG